MVCISIFDAISNHIQELSLFVSALSALIAAIATVVAFKANSQNKKQYNESIQPQLSMSLIEYDSLLYLRVKNTGKLAAKNLEIKVKAVRNNGNPDNACLLDILAGRSLSTDLLAVMNKESKEILTRSETIKETHGNAKKENSNAHA